MSDLDLPPGSVVCRRFEILGGAKQGSFGLTYPARDQRSGQKVALKEYFPRKIASRAPNGDVAFAQSQFALDGRAFMKEAAALALCPKHPAIAKFVFADVDRHTGYIAQEWIEGTTLAESDEVDDRVLTSWFLQLLDAVLALAATSRQYGAIKLVHHDITPNNIMIRHDGSAVLVDFGAAQLLSETGYYDIDASGATMNYAAPEVLARAPGTLSRASEAGVWTDIFGLCASFYDKICGKHPVKFDRAAQAVSYIEEPLLIRQLKNDPLLAARNSGLLDAIDLGLNADLLVRPRNALPFLDRLRITADALPDFLPQGFDGNALLAPEEELASYPTTPFHACREEVPGSMPERFQTAIIQSLDSARFQESAFRTQGGEAQDNTPEQKIALARTEVFLNLMFGREIVIPAGHIADSKAVVAIVGEVLEIYQNKFQQRIDLACARHKLPAWRPFRLAIEDARNREGYTGFVRAYHYTGATLPVLMAAGRKHDFEKEEGKEAFLEKIRAAFLDRRFSDLDGDVQQGFGAYAARAERYFADDTSQFPIDIRPIESLAAYAGVFKRRIDNTYVSGAGVSQAKDSLRFVDEIQAKLLELRKHGEQGATGFRGNWYLFSEGFHEVWPLARGYLDAKLYVEIAAKYGIDHPVLVSQAYEYGEFDHSLVLGPSFGVGIAEDPEWDSGLTELTASLSSKLPWDALFDLFTQDRFLTSVRRLNEGYRRGGGESYRDAIVSHGELVADSLETVRVESRSGQVIVTPSDDERARFTINSYDAVLLALEHEERMRRTAESIFPGLDNSTFDAAGASILPLHRALRSSEGAAPVIVHYFVKPIRLRYVLPAAA